MPRGQQDYLVRVSRDEGGLLAWEDRVVRVFPPPPEPIMVEMDVEALEQLKGLPRVQATLEVDFFAVLTPLRKDGIDRPVFPHVLLIVDRDSGLVLATQLMAPIPSMSDMWGQLPSEIVHQLLEIGGIPQEMVVRSEMHFTILERMADELGIRLRRARTLRSLDPAKESLIQWMDRSM